MIGWTATHTLSLEFQPFVKCELELSIQNDRLLWGSRVAVPPKLRERALQEFHLISWKFQNEEYGTSVHLVAWHEPQHKEYGQELQSMSGNVPQI